MPQTTNFYLDFQVTGSERKRLVNAISEFVGEDARYLGAPSFAYQVDHFTVDRAGCVSFDRSADNDEIAGLLEALANQGFVSASSNFGLPEEDEAEPQAAQVEESGDCREEALGAEATDAGEPEEATESDVGESPQAPGAAKILKPDETAEQAGAADEAASENASSVPGASSDMLARLDALRASLVREINRQFKEFLRADGTTAPRDRTAPSRGAPAQNLAPGQTATVPLSGDISTLRGTKPVFVKIGDNAISATSWKQVVAVVLDVCNREEVYHQALLQARDAVVGRGRKLLADTSQGMYSPLRIDEALYMETNFSTEALLKLLRDRVLNGIGYDAGGITLEYRRP